MTVAQLFCCATGSKINAPSARPSPAAKPARGCRTARLLHSRATHRKFEGNRPLKVMKTLVPAFRSPIESDSASGSTHGLALPSSDNPLPAFPESIAVFVVFEDGISTISTIHAVINRLRILHLQFTRHNQPCLSGSMMAITSVVSHKRLELFFLVFSHSGACAAGLDPLQCLFAAA